MRYEEEEKKGKKFHKWLWTQKKWRAYV